MIIQDCNLIASQNYRNPYVPNEVYTSGQREETSLTDKYGISLNIKDNAVLVLEDDIVNDDGYGLKKGFYNVRPDKYFDFLLIFQSGELKAKVPVINMEVFETLNPEQQKVKKMSQRAYQRKLKKEQKKYAKGLTPEQIDYKEAKIQYIADKNAYIIIYNNDNIELTGIIKF